MPPAAPKIATYQDVLDSPQHLIAEVVEGVLYQSPRPGKPHAQAASVVGEELGRPFKRGKGGPGGWLILDEPEIHLGRDIVVPDLAGWRRERMPEMDQGPYFEMAPNWLCEVASPSTRALDRGKKLGVYQREGVQHIWFIEPLDHYLEVLELAGENYRILQRVYDVDIARIVPFDAIEFDVAALWQR